jgi:hypothetical protein
MPQSDTIAEPLDPKKIQDALAIVKGEMQKLENATPEEKKKLMDIIYGETIQQDLRPNGWSANSIAPYYKLKYALKLKPYLDDLLKNPGQGDYFFDRAKSRNSVRTIALYVNQAWLYLIEREPYKTEGKYQRLKELTAVHKEKGGVRIEWKIPSLTQNNVTEQFGKPEKVATEKVTAKNWRQIFEHYIDNAEEGELLEIIGLELAPADIEMIKNAVEDIKSLHVVNMDKNKVKIVKNSKMLRP